MAESALAKKMKLKPGHRAVLVNAPDGYRRELAPLPDRVELAQKLTGQFDWIQVFVRTRAELEKLAPRVIKALKPAGIVWFSYPKGTSKIQTDLTRDKGWEALHGAELKWLTLVSVNDIWSAFALRPYKEGEKREVR